MATLNEHIDEQLDKQRKAHVLVKMCETLDNLELLKLLQVGLFRNTKYFDQDEDYIVCVKYETGENELEHYEWTI